VTYLIFTSLGVY